MREGKGKEGEWKADGKETLEVQVTDKERQGELMKEWRDQRRG